MMNWQGFWNGDHSIYVNARHRQIHDSMLARDIVAEIKSPGLIVLDYACGEATEAHHVAAQCATLILSDGAATVREKLKQRYAMTASIVIQSPDETKALTDGSVDLIIVNSLLQYLNRDDTETLMRMLHAKLKPAGRLIIGDVIPPHVPALTDALALLRFGAQHGFFFAAFGGLIRTVFSDYRKIRGALGLTMWEESDFLTLLSNAGFTARRLTKNFGHNQARMAFECIKMS